MFYFTGSCIIDCIFSKSDSTFYIIDVMYWKDQDLQDCEVFIEIEGKGFSLPNVNNQYCV